MSRAPAWVLACVAFAIPLLLPLAVVAATALAPAGDAWRHLAATVLPEYVGTSRASAWSESRAPSA